MATRNKSIYIVGFTNRERTQHFSYKVLLTGMEYMQLTAKLKALDVAFEVVQEKFYHTASYADIVAHIETLEVVK